MTKPCIKHTWICSPWYVHRRDKWWRPIRWPLMLFWSWWWKILSSFTFQLIAFFLFRHLVFIHKLLKGRLGPIFCTTRFSRFRPTGLTNWSDRSCQNRYGCSYLAPPAELENYSTTLFESWSPLGTVLLIELSDCSSTTGFSLSSVKSKFLFNRPSFLIR